MRTSLAILPYVFAFRRFAEATIPTLSDGKPVWISRSMHMLLGSIPQRDTRGQELQLPGDFTPYPVERDGKNIYNLVALWIARQKLVSLDPNIDGLTYLEVTYAYVLRRKREIVQAVTDRNGPERMAVQAARASQYAPAQYVAGLWVAPWGDPAAMGYVIPLGTNNSLPKKLAHDITWETSGSQQHVRVALTEGVRCVDIHYALDRPVAPFALMQEYRLREMWTAFTWPSQFTLLSDCGCAHGLSVAVSPKIYPLSRNLCVVTDPQRGAQVITPIGAVVPDTFHGAITESEVFPSGGIEGRID